MLMTKRNEVIINQISWAELQKLAKDTAYRRGKEEPYSPNQASYALDILGISYLKVVAFIDKKGDCQIAWQ
jgi:hypothetical protein